MTLLGLLAELNGVSGLDGSLCQSQFPDVGGYVVVVLESVFFGGKYTLEYVGVMGIGFTT